MDTKITKVIALNILLIGLVLFLSGCVNQVYTPEVSPISPTLTITTSLPSATATVPATETQLPPYPKSAENFVKKPSISGAEAEKRIVEKGAGEDLNAMKDWYRANGVADANMFPVLYEEAGEFYWNLAAKSGNGNFLKFTITSGAEADQVVRAMGMVAYLYTRPTFRTSELKTPDELNGTTQEMMWDRSGWSVVGTFKEGVMTGWYNADSNTWLVEQVQAPEASPTPEQTEIHSSFEINGEVEGLPVKVTFSIAKDTYEREVRPLDRWEFNPIFVEKYGEEEARNLMAGIIMKAHFFAWQEDDWEGRKGVSLSDYVQRIKNGEDMSYEIYASDRDSVVQGEKKMVDPSKPVEIIFSEKTGGNMGINPVDKFSTLLYSESGSLTIEHFADPAYIEIDNLSKGHVRVTDALWEGVASGLYLIAYDIRYQIPGAAGSGDMGTYQMWLAENRPGQDQMYLDFYKYAMDFYKYDTGEDFSLIPIRVRER